MIDKLKEVTEFCDFAADIIHSPERVQKAFSNIVGDDAEVIITGDISNRLALMIGDTNVQLMASFNSTLGNHPITQLYAADLLNIERPDQRVSPVKLNGNVLERLRRPRIKMVALYHPENFPLPRFPLGISDIARAVRQQMIGQISLTDMQLDKNLEMILREIAEEYPDIVGISATFGQQDLMEELIKKVQNLEGYDPLIVVGGSLAALNSHYLLEKFPEIVVGLGYGETTMQDIAQYWHGMKKLSDVNHISYFSSSGVIDTAKIRDDKMTESFPELDLLDDILAKKGVMQLESSRGCTYACSFCPRGHKGIWAANSGGVLPQLMSQIRRLYDRHPEIARKMFLVDEEFIGYRGEDDTLARAKEIADVMSSNEFTFESMTRIDQVYRPHKDKIWHEKRIKFWRYLAKNNLSRMLFGMESGVDSILKRFNKKTTSDQNVRAIRILTSCGVPIRLSFITFDPLMDMDELIGNYKFQGRRDIILKTAEDLSAEKLFDATSDDSYVEGAKINEPLYRKISYMLVSMECLLGSNYLKEVENHGLARDVSLSMGRRNVNYREPDIGLMSQYSQLWIDRMFSLDYTLKSIEKVCDKEQYEDIHQLRILLKDFAYDLLGKMLAIVHNDSSLLSFYVSDQFPDFLKESQSQWASGTIPAKRSILSKLLNKQFELIKNTIRDTLSNISDNIHSDHRSLIENAYSSLENRQEWQLINT